MEAIIARGIQVLIALSGAYLVALWFVLVVWTYRDIESRSRSVVTQIFSTLLAALFFVPGVLLYLILRPKETLDVAFQRSLEEEYLLQDLEELPLCHKCHRYVEDDFILCPHCHTRLREACGACGRLVHLRWSLCPYCGAEQSEKAAIERERVVAPAARWAAASRPRRRATPVIVSRPAVPAFGERTMPAVEQDGAREALGAPQSNGRDAMNGAPVRLFDRRKTRAALRSNGNGAANAATSWPDTARQLHQVNGAPIEDAQQGELINGNGRPEAADEGAPRSLAALFARHDRERESSGSAEDRLPARLLTEKD